MMTSEVETAALEALRVAQQKYDETVEVLRMTRSRLATASTGGAVSEILAAEAKVRGRRAEFSEAARVLEEAARALVITRSALEAAEEALVGLRARSLERAPLEALQEALAAAESAVALGRERLEAAGRDLARSRAERAAGEARRSR